MIKLFKRRNTKKPAIIDTAPIVNEEHKELTFEDKVVYIPKKRIESFPVMYESPEGKITYFCKDKYISEARKVYDIIDIDKYIHRVEIVGELPDAGQCEYEIIDGNLRITIRVAAHKLGIICHTGYIWDYKDEQCKIFTDILAHELFHAEDIVRICEEHGIDEVSKIKKSENLMVKLAFNTFSEYKACRGTADNFNSFDTAESLDRCLNISNLTLKEGIKNYKKESPMLDQLKRTIFYVNYVIATFCAFADVSADKEKDLVLSDYVSGHSIFTYYINKLRKMLNEYYSFSTSLTEEMYQSLGKQMMYDLVSVYGVVDEKKNDVIMGILK